jgi:hypothetical protein
MLIKNSLSDAVSFFHLDALSSALGLKVDFDADDRQRARPTIGAAEARLRRRAGPTDFSGFSDLSAQVHVDDNEVRVEFHRPVRPRCGDHLVAKSTLKIDHLRRQLNRHWLAFFRSGEMPNQKRVKLWRKGPSR